MRFFLERLKMNQKHPLFSIITINYNGLEGLKQSMTSVIAQTFKDFEYIVIDGGSTDGSAAYIESHQENLDYWISEKDKGIYNAMNKGVAQAKGEYIYFLNSGDYFLFPEILTLISQKLDENKKPDVLVTGVLQLNPENGSYMLNIPKQVDKISLFHKMICHQTLFVKRTIFDALGNFDESYVIKADYEWLLRVVSSNSYSFNYFNTVIAFYPLGGASDTSYSTHSVKEIPAIRNKYYSKESETLLRRYIHRPSLRNVSNYLLENTNFRNKILKKIQ